jgi:hypothetical protein
MADDDASSFFHLSSITIGDQACQGTACFLARHRDPATWGRAARASPRVHCLGRCFAAPATAADTGRPHVEVAAPRAWCWTASPPAARPPSPPTGRTTGTRPWTKPCASGHSRSSRRSRPRGCAAAAGRPSRRGASGGRPSTRAPRRPTWCATPTRATPAPTSTAISSRTIPTPCSRALPSPRSPPAPAAATCTCARSTRRRWQPSGRPQPRRGPRASLVPRWQVKARRSTWRSSRARAATCAARRPHCSTRWKAADQRCAPDRPTHPSMGCSARPRRSTTSRPWPLSPGSSATAPPPTGRWAPAAARAPRSCP